MGVNRSNEDISLWKKRDPINRILESLYQKDFLTKEKYNKIIEKFNEDIEKAWIKAKDDPFPKKSDLMSNVYSQ